VNERNDLRFIFIRFDILALSYHQLNAVVLTVYRACLDCFNLLLYLG
jgi:hypothetical protein